MSDKVYGPLPHESAKIQIVLCDNRELDLLAKRAHRFISKEDPGATHEVLIDYDAMSEDNRRQLESDYAYTNKVISTYGIVNESDISSFAAMARESQRENVGQHYIFVVCNPAKFTNLSGVANYIMLTKKLEEYSLDDDEWKILFGCFERDMCDHYVEVECMFYRKRYSRTLTIENMMGLANAQLTQVSDRSTLCTLHLGPLLLSKGFQTARPATEYKRYLGELYSKEDAHREAYNYIGGVLAFLEHTIGIDHNTPVKLYDTADLCYYAS